MKPTFHVESAREAKRRREKEARRAPPPRRTHASKLAVIDSLEMAVASCSTEPATVDQRNAMLLPGHAAIERLRMGTLDIEGLALLFELNTTAFFLACRIYHHGAKPPDIEALQPDFFACGEALSAIGERQVKTGRYGATGDELNTIKVSVSLLVELIDLAPFGHVVTAAREAGEEILRRFGAQDLEDAQAANKRRKTA